MALGGAGQTHQCVAHAPIDGYEFRVARAPIVKHRLLHTEGGGQRAGREQPGILGWIRSYRSDPLGGIHGNCLSGRLEAPFGLPHVNALPTIRQITSFYKDHRFHL